MTASVGVQKAINAAGGKSALAKLWGVSVQAIYGFETRGYFPPARAKDAHDRWGIPMHEMVKPEIADTYR